MITDEQFHMALFAIDSYSRGYDSGLRNEGEDRRSDPNGLRILDASSQSGPYFAGKTRRFPCEFHF
jgi:hypothetical protein